MEAAQRAQIVSELPQAAGKTMLFAHWLEGPREVVDPFGREHASYVDAIALLRLAAAAWKERLSGVTKR